MAFLNENKSSEFDWRQPKHKKYLWSANYTGRVILKIGVNKPETHKGVETCNVGTMLRNIQMAILGVLIPYLDVKLDSRWPLQSRI